MMMVRRVFAWLLWPLVFSAYVAAMVAVATYDAASLERWLGVAMLALIVVLIGLEEILLVPARLVDSRPPREVARPRPLSSLQQPRRVPGADPVHHRQHSLDVAAGSGRRRRTVADDRSVSRPGLPGDRSRRPARGTGRIACRTTCGGSGRCTPFTTPRSASARSRPAAITCSTSSRAEWLPGRRW